MGTPRSGNAVVGVGLTRGVDMGVIRADAQALGTEGAMSPLVPEGGQINELNDNYIFIFHYKLRCGYIYKENSLLFDKFINFVYLDISYS